MLQLRPLDDTNFYHFIGLLKDRGEAPEDYYRWKYLDQPGRGAAVGFVAYYDELPVGCIGVLNRTYVSADKKEISATWFADWYVSKKIRGKGVGQRLMEEVRKQGDVNFGIPGPKPAQVVCHKAGYEQLAGFNEYVTYLRPYRCGYFRYSGSGLKRTLRAFRSVMKYYNSVIRHAAGRGDGHWSDGLPPSEYWAISAKRSLENRPHLKRDADWIDWIKRMPSDESKKRQWWFINCDLFYACGFAENDFWGLRRARIVDLFVLDEKYDFAQCLSRVLSLMYHKKIDLANFSFFSESLTSSFLHGENPLPVFKAHNQKKEIGYLSSLDKESAWREFLMN